MDVGDDVGSAEQEDVVGLVAAVDGIDGRFGALLITATGDRVPFDPLHVGTRVDRDQPCSKAACVIRRDCCIEG